MTPENDDNEQVFPSMSLQGKLASEVSLGAQCRATCKSQEGRADSGEVAVKVGFSFFKCFFFFFFRTKWLLFRRYYNWGNKVVGGFKVWSYYGSVFELTTNAAV